MLCTWSVCGGQKTKMILLIKRRLSGIKTRLDRRFSRFLADNSDMTDAIDRMERFAATTGLSTHTSIDDFMADRRNPWRVGAAITARVSLCLSLMRFAGAVLIADDQ